jgi:hypothetical protein
MDHVLSALLGNGCISTNAAHQIIIGVWIVCLLALLGNGCVVFVLVLSRSKMDVLYTVYVLMPHIILF